jgi:hypothetical protein
MEKAIEFLLKNGFERNETNSYTNNHCNVVFEDDVIVVADNHGSTMYSKDFNMYWLIGVLTYYGHISRDYKV